MSALKVREFSRRQAEAVSGAVTSGAWITIMLSSAITVFDDMPH